MKNWIERVIFSGLLAIAVNGCAVVSAVDSVDVSVQGANYTDDYLSFTVKSVSGKNLGIGNDVKKFSDGGTSGGVCCGVIPKPGGLIKIEWKVGEKEYLYSSDVLVLGRAGEDLRKHSYLIVRFFPGNEVEAEVIGSSLGQKNLRMDRLYLGIRQMRHKGE